MTHRRARPGRNASKGGFPDIEYCVSHHFTYKMKLIYLLIVIAASMLFCVVFSSIAERQDAKAMTEIERLEFEEARMLINEIRQSGMIGLNLNGNPEL